jgi:hypothetical protein
MSRKMSLERNPFFFGLFGAQYRLLDPQALFSIITEWELFQKRIFVPQRWKSKF